MRPVEPIRCTDLFAPLDGELIRLLRGLAPEDWARREANQKPIDEKRNRADCSVDNEGPSTEVRRAVESLWRLFLRGRGSNDCIPHEDG